MTLSRRSIQWNEIERARRRLSREEGALVKDWGGKLPFAFVYPNRYFIGMSNLGLQAIYAWLNARQEIVCERVFWDSENARGGALPVSLESQRPLNDFAVLAFSLNYELDYFNVPAVLRSSGLPLYSRERNESHPLVIAGGPCISANPLPVSPFFDALCIGEAEALLPSLLPVLAGNLSSNRADLLKDLSGVPGVYVPACPPENPVKRQWVKLLDSCPTHSVVLTGETELKDLYLIEAERGCAHRCRFCLVSNSFSPIRFHSLASLIAQARQGLKFRRRLGLVGPAVTDHPQIEDLFDELLKMNAQFSVSSLRISSLTSGLLKQMKQGGLKSVALAPEAGSQCLRQVIKKGISEAQILEAVGRAAEAGMEQIKLYFMLGLPRETDEDVLALADLALQAKSNIERRKCRTRLSLNIAPFVPKANTPFQWLGMSSLELIQRRLTIVKSRLAHEGIQVKSESPQWSEVQAVLSRGDAALAPALAEVDSPSLPAWAQALQNLGVDASYYSHATWNLDARLPWHFIDQGDSAEKLKGELNLALA
jgi:radical SAM superfamily enzyme YgiQ (UPF0313 family)